MGNAVSDNLSDGHQAVFLEPLESDRVVESTKTVAKVEPQSQQMVDGLVMSAEGGLNPTVLWGITNQYAVHLLQQLGVSWAPHRPDSVPGLARDAPPQRATVTKEHYQAGPHLRLSAEQVAGRVRGGVCPVRSCVPSLRLHV